MSELRHIMQGHCPGAGQNKRGVSTDRAHCAACRASRELWGILRTGGFLDPHSVRRTERESIQAVEARYDMEWNFLQRQGWQTIRLFAQPVEAVRP